MRRAPFALLLFAVCACGRTEKPVARVAAPPPPPRVNLVSLPEGGSVVSRTAELDLHHSATRMIDTSNGTGWVTPAGDPTQTVVLSLPARARVDRVGIVTSSVSSAARDLRIDFSLDGETFTRSVPFQAKKVEGEQDVAVTPPVEAQYIRLSTLNGNSEHLLIRETIVNGTYLAQPAAAPIDGRWSINGEPATFHSDRASVFGYAGGTNDIMLDGGSDGRFYRFAWIQDKQYGLAALSVTPDGKHLTAIVWHEQAIDVEQFYGEDWLGDSSAPRTEVRGPTSVDVFTTYLQRFGYFPLYALRFSNDGTLDENASAPELARVAKIIAANPQLQVRFVAHELTHPSAGENLAVSQKKIATLRDALSRHGLDVSKTGFLALGDAQPRRAGTNPLIRAMYSSVDLEVRR